jgi:hypothetical protein
VRSRDQLLIPDGMPEAVIDDLKMIEIQEEDGKQIVLATFGARDGTLEPRPEQDSVWQASQHIVKRIE